MKKVAVVGGGQIFETVHLPAIQKTADAQLVAMVELNEKREKELSLLCPNIKIYDDIEKMIQEEEITDAIVCVPNKFHCQVTMKLLNNKINVLCEKPPAINAMEAKQMYECSIENNCNLYYNFHLRQIEYLHDIKVNKDDIYHIDINALRRRGIPGWGSFINKDIQGGGALIDLGIHYLDLVFSLTKDYDFTSISAIIDDYIGKHETDGDFGSWNNENFTVENFCSATLKSNYLLNLKTSFAHNMEQKDQYQVHIYTHQSRIDLLQGQIYDLQNKPIFSGDEQFDQTKLRIKSSVEFLQGSYNNMCDGLQGYKIQEIVQKIYENANN